MEEDENDNQIENRNQKRKNSPSIEEFQSKDYWNKRYLNEDLNQDFDWFKNYSELKLIFDQYIKEKSLCKILMLGCGNSTLSNEMLKDGYKNIINIDYSSILIEKMKFRFPLMDWRVMDVRELENNIESLGGKESFDLIIDKGTMDALMSEKGSVWNPSENVKENVKKEIDGILKLLKSKTGIFFYLTWMQPQFRKQFIKRNEWEIEIKTIGNGNDLFHYFLYIVKKN